MYVMSTWTWDSKEQIYGKGQTVRKSTTNYVMHAFLMRENIYATAIIEVSWPPQ